MISSFKHECDAWDGLLIDRFDIEFAFCECFQGPEFEAAIAQANKELDEQREIWEKQYGDEELF